MSGLHRVPGVIYSALVLNQRGFERALAAGADEIHFSFACTDAFAHANQNSSVAMGLASARQLTAMARAAGRPITITLSVAFGCPFTGAVAPSHVLQLAQELMQQAPDEIVVADTIGVARPSEVRSLVRDLCSLGAAIGVHLHDTRGMACANAYSALESGASGLDASVGGAGGCPFAPGATGNVATEDLVYLLEGMGIKTGVSMDRLVEVTSWLEQQLGHDLPSRVARAWRSTP